MGQNWLRGMGVVLLRLRGKPRPGKLPSTSKRAWRGPSTGGRPCRRGEGVFKRGSRRGGLGQGRLRSRAAGPSSAVRQRRLRIGRGLLRGLRQAPAAQRGQHERRCAAARPVRCGPAGRALRALCRRLRYSHCGGMSGASVSSTSTECPAAAGRQLRGCCSERSKLSVPPKPSLQTALRDELRRPAPSLPLKAWAMPPGTVDAAAGCLQQRVGRAPHVQD